MRRMLGWVVTAALVTLGLLWLGRAIHLTLHPVVVPVGLVVMVFAVLAVRSGWSLLDAPWKDATPAPPRSTGDRRLRSIAWAARDHGGGAWEYTVRPVLLASITDWLRDQGADPEHHPHAAADRLPAELRPLLTDPTYRPSGPTDLARIVTRIEQLWTTHA